MPGSSSCSNVTERRAGRSSRSDGSGGGARTNLHPANTFGIFLPLETRDEPVGSGAMSPP